MNDDSNLVEWILLFLGLLVVIQVKIIPLLHIPEISQEIIFLFSGWRLYFSIIILLFPLVIFLNYKFNFYIFNKRLEKRQKEEKENSNYWEKLRKEEERKEREEQERLGLNQKEPEVEQQSGYAVEKPKKKRQININVDFNKNFYKKKEINLHEIKYLLKQNYREVRYKSIISGKEEDFIIRPRFNESTKHMIVIYDIANYLDLKEVNYELFTTRMPDIVIKRKTDFAIEVETGSVINNMQKFNVKLELLKNNFGRNWAFLVTNRNLIKKYRRFGKVIDPRFIKFNIDRIIKNN